MSASPPISPPILSTPTEATAAWFNNLFADRGAGEVTGVRSEPVGTGQMAHNERFFLTWSDAAAAAAAGLPETIVGKFPSPNEDSRAAGARGGYLKEVNFYRMIAPTVAVRTPHAWYAAATQDSTEFTLMLEDLAPSVQGDQLAGCSIDQARDAVVNLAGLHGPRWNDPTLDDHDWLRPALDDEGLAFLDAIYTDYTAQFLDRYADRLTDAHRSVLVPFAERVTDWVARSAHGRGLVHGDYRLDNLLFATTPDSDPVGAVDWQTVTLGSPPNDLAYFLGNGLDPELRRTHEDDLVAAYHEALCHTHGVAEYPLNTCRYDYRIGSFQGPLITVLGSIAVVVTERGNEMFMAMLDRSVRQILDLNALDLLAEL